MGAADALASGIRRAVRGVRSALPGASEESTVSESVSGDSGLTEQVPDLVAAAARPEPADAAGAAQPKRAVTSPNPRPAPARPVARARTAATTPTAAVPLAAAPPAALAPAFTDDELASFRSVLELELERLRSELHTGEVDLADLVADAADGTGDDQADTGSKRLEREQEMSVNANTRELIDQTVRALRRLDDGTYGVCESCGAAIRAGRLRAYPRATKCIACKQAEERR